MVPAYSHKVSRVSWYSGNCYVNLIFAYGILTLFDRSFQCRSANLIESMLQSHTPECMHSGLGSFGFARRYSRNHFCFLFLRLLRCFSSPGSLCTPMDSVHSDQGLLGRVSPFRHLRIDVYLPLPAAFRSLSRLSSALSAKASTLRSSLLHYLGITNLCVPLETE